MNRPILLLAATLVLATGCTREEVAERESTSTAAAPPGMAAIAEALDRMDTRTPVPMVPMMAQHQKENMRDHLLAVQEIIVALASDDFAAAERAAARIGFSVRSIQVVLGEKWFALGLAICERKVRFENLNDGVANGERIGKSSGLDKRGVIG